MTQQPVEDKKKKGKKGKGANDPEVEELKNNMEKMDLEADDGAKKNNKKGMCSNAF